MNKNRSIYFVIALSVCFVGILSRKISGIPLFVGDILYAIFIYFGMRCLFLLPKKITLFFSIAFCFLIEFSQLIDLSGLNKIRSTTIGHYALGEGFLWSDLLCYLIGVSLAFLIDNKLFFSSSID